MAKYDIVDKNIDRSLDDFGRFFKRRWWLVLGLILIVWWTLANGVLRQLAVTMPEIDLTSLRVAPAAPRRQVDVGGKR